VYVDIETTAVELAEFVDLATVLVAISVLSTEIAEFFDANTVLVQIFPSGVEVYEITDSAMIYVDIQPSSVGIIIEFILEILGYETRWWVDIPLVSKRWAALEMRRWSWKS
jgi:hypothetical protein